MVPRVTHLLLGVLLVSGAAHADQWMREYAQRFTVVRTTADGGYVAAGDWVAKLDSRGNPVWQNTYSVPVAPPYRTVPETVRAIEQTRDGGYVVATTFLRSQGIDANTDFGAMKLDASGNVVWSKRYGGDDSEITSDVQPTADGGYIIAGYIDPRPCCKPPRAWLVKVDADGEILWQDTYDRVSRASRVRQTADGGYVVGGEVALDGFDAPNATWIFKLDAGGGIQWQKVYGKTFSGGGMVAIEPGTDGGYLVALSRVILSLDASGNLEWQKIINSASYITSLESTHDGGFVASGSYFIPYPTLKGWPMALKLDARGDPVWQKTFGDGYALNPLYPSLPQTSSVQETADGGYIFAGQYLTKVDANGEIAGCGLVQAATSATEYSGIDMSPQDVDVEPVATSATTHPVEIVRASVAVDIEQSCASQSDPTAVEFYNASLDHYFMTWMPDEIAKLDAGVEIRGWTRTGESFKPYALPQTGTSAVCRYYIPPELGDSHFFGRDTLECNATAQKFSALVLEDPRFMYILLPTAGTCPENTTPIYRVFSNRADANHRYMTDRAIRDEMVAKGWIAEGDGPDLVVMCAP